MTFPLGLEFLNEAEEREKQRKRRLGISAVTIRFTEQSLLILMSVFRVGFNAQFHRLSQEARVALGYRLGQLLRFFRALQTSQVLHNSIVHAKA